MNFSLQLGKFSLNLGGAAKSINPAQWLRGDDGTRGGATMVSALEQSTWVYSCVTLLSESVSQIPFRLISGDEDNEKVQTGGPEFDLFAHPHPQLDRFAFWDLLVSWLMLKGEAFILPLDKQGAALGSGSRVKPATLLILPPDSFRHVIDGNRLALWQYTGAGAQSPLGTAVFLPEEIIHIKLTHPYDFWRGLAPLRVAMLSASSDYASAQFEKGLMMNNADTGVIVTTDQQPDETQRLAISMALKERKRAAGTADRPLFLWGGAKVDRPTVSSADMQFLENRKFKRQEICAVFKVPQELLGFTEDANRSVGDMARLNFIENRIAPLCARIEAALNRLIERIDPRLRGEFHIKGTPVMQAAQRARWDVALKAFNAGVPLNTANKVFDLGLPMLAHGDRAYLPFSLQPVDADGMPDVPDAPAADSTVPPGDTVPVKELRAALAVLKAAEGKRGEGEKEIVKTIHQCGSSGAYAASIAGSVKRKRTTLRNFFVGQQERVLANIDKVEGDKLKVAGSETKAVEDIFDLLAENEKLWKKMTPLLKGDLLFGGAQVWQELGLNADDFAIPPQKAIEFLAKRSNEIKQINSTTFSKLKDSLAQALKDGDTHAEIVARVKEVYSGATDARAETIATTETNIATNAGRFEGMKEAGAERKGWQATNLEGVRPEHLQAELDYQDEGVPIDEPFIVAGEELMHPGDPSGSAGNVINCRCFTFAIFPEKSGARGAARPTRHLSYEEFARREEAKATSSQTIYNIKDRVRVRPGKQHDEMTGDKAGTIAEISTPGLGIKFDGMDEVHRWYTDEEVEKA